MTTVALIIDDNKANRDVLHLMLRANGVTPVALDSPRFLDRALEQQPKIDLVFLDLEFPNYDGLTLARTLKAHPALRHAPIIAYTVHTSEIDMARSAGFDGFLGKPLDPHRFADQLRRILDGEAVWD